MASLLKRLGFVNLTTAMRRLMVLTLAAATLCAVCYPAVALTASATVRRREQWPAPDVWHIATMISVQILIMGATALAGRKVLRLRLV